LLDSPKWKPKWIHPKTSDTYTLRLVRATLLTDAELRACFDLIEETSGADYRASAAGWHSDQKRKEMRDENLRYILVSDQKSEIRGFTSLMPCFEDGQAVVYCFEIHLKDELRR